MQLETGVIGPGGFGTQRGIPDEAWNIKIQLINRGRVEGTAGRSGQAQPWGRIFDELYPRASGFPRLAVMVVAAAGDQGQGLEMKLLLSEEPVVLDKMCE